MLHVSLHITNNFVEVLIFTYLFKCLISFFHVAFYEFESKLYLVVAVITADGNPLTNSPPVFALRNESYKYYKNKELVGNKWVKQFHIYSLPNQNNRVHSNLCILQNVNVFSTSYEIIICSLRSLDLGQHRTVLSRTWSLNGPFRTDLRACLSQSAFVVMKELDNSLDKQSSFRARGKCRSRPKTYFFTCGKQCKYKYGIFSG